MLFAAIPVGAVLGGLFSGTFSRARRHGLMVIGAVVAWGAAIRCAAGCRVSSRSSSRADRAGVLHGTAGSAFGARQAVVAVLGLALAVPALRRYRV